MSSTPCTLLETSAANEAELDALEHRVEEALFREKGARAFFVGLPTSCRVSLAASGALVITSSVCFLAPRVDLHAYPMARLWVTAAFLALLLESLIVLYLRPVQRPNVALLTWGAVALGLAAPFAVSLLPEAQLSHPVSTEGLGKNCLVIGGACAVVLMLLLRALHRTPGAIQLPFVAAAAGGVIANLALTFHCPLRSPLHLVVIHAPLGLALLLGYGAVSLATARRRRERPA